MSVDARSLEPRPLEPIRSNQRMRFLDDEQLDRLQDATFRILEEVGIRFPSDTALEILGDHGAKVDRDSQMPARRAIEMATVLAGSRDALRKRPMLSDLICSIAPLAQDQEGLEAALAFAEAGIPVGLLAMPTLGTTAPATSAGALVVGDAEVISGIVLLQLAYPGAPVFHPIMKAWADPRNGHDVGYSIDSRARYAPVEMAHRLGLPSMAACFGTDSPSAGTWQAGVEVALDPFLGGLAGPELVTGLGLARTYTLLYPEAIGPTASRSMTSV